MGCAGKDVFATLGPYLMDLYSGHPPVNSLVDGWETVITGEPGKHAGDGRARTDSGASSPRLSREWETNFHTVFTHVLGRPKSLLGFAWLIMEKSERTFWPAHYFCCCYLVAQMVKNLPAMRGTWVWSLGWEDPLEEDMATHCSILAWRTPMDREAWWATVHGVSKSQTRLSD